MVSGQGKLGLPLLGIGSAKEHGFWGGRSGTRMGLPSLAGTGGQLGESNQGETKSNP